MTLANLACQRIISTADRQAWLKARQNFIGASDMPALFLDPNAEDTPAYLHPANVWSYGVFGPSDTDTASEAAETGLWIEPHLLDRAASLLGATSTERGRWLYQSTAYPWLSATLDGWILLPGEDAIPQEYAYLRPYADQWVCTEIKNTAKWADWIVRPGALYDLPERFWIQAQAQMAVTGLGVVLVVAFVCGRDFHLVPVLRDDAFIAHMVEYSRAFHDAIQRRDRSILGLGRGDHSEAAEKLLRRIFPAPDPAVPAVDCPQEFVTAWLRGKAGVDLLAATKVMVLNHMEHASEAVAPDGSRFKRSKSGALTWSQATKERE